MKKKLFALITVMTLMLAMAVPSFADSSMSTFSTYPPPNGAMYITCNRSGTSRVLNVYTNNSYASNNNNVVTWSNTGDVTQHFKSVSYDSGKYYIEPIAMGAYTDLSLNCYWDNGSISGMCTIYQRSFNDPSDYLVFYSEDVTGARIMLYNSGKALTETSSAIGAGYRVRWEETRQPLDQQWWKFHSL